MRRYRIEVWPARTGPRWECGAVDRLSATECTADEFVNANDADAVLEVYALTLGQSVTLGGGAAPITVITCIEE